VGITFTPDGTALVLAAPGSPGLVERWDVTPEGGSQRPAGQRGAT
jgi:hypothetical protein